VGESECKSSHKIWNAQEKSEKMACRICIRWGKAYRYFIAQVLKKRISTKTIASKGNYIK
jgi:hypothetical protein